MDNRIPIITRSIEEVLAQEELDKSKTLSELVQDQGITISGEAMALWIEEKVAEVNMAMDGSKKMRFKTNIARLKMRHDTLMEMAEHFLKL